MKLVVHIYNIYGEDITSSILILFVTMLLLLGWILGILEIASNIVGSPKLEFYYSKFERSFKFKFNTKPTKKEKKKALRALRKALKKGINIDNTIQIIIKKFATTHVEELK